MAADWTVYDYEVGMFNGLLAIAASRVPASYTTVVRNAIVESLLLHARIICDILLSLDKNADALTIETLLPGFTPPSLAALKKTYGERSDPASPRSLINKRLAHSTNVRGSNFDWALTLNALQPLIAACLTEIDIQRKKQKSL